MIAKDRGLKLNQQLNVAQAPISRSFDVITCAGDKIYGVLRPPECNRLHRMPPIAQKIAICTMRLALIVALAFAPAASAFAACATTARAAAMAGEAKQPCDAPCKDCKADAKQTCKGDCVCVKTMIASPIGEIARGDTALELTRAPVSGLIARAHPPDPPPPRTLPL